MQLYGTPPSHFTRKVRIVLQELGLPYEFLILSQLLEVGERHFAQNPLHMFPVLEDGGTRLFESDLICDYLISTYGNGHALSSFLPSLPNQVKDRQRLAIMNGGMSAGVTLIRAKRSGILDWAPFAYFRQELAAIEAALHWLEKDLGPATGFYPERFTILEITLICFLEWAAFREFLKDWSAFPNLAAFAQAHASRPSVRATHPALAEAKQ